MQGEGDTSVSLRGRGVRRKCPAHTEILESIPFEIDGGIGPRDLPDGKVSDANLLND